MQGYRGIMIQQETNEALVIDTKTPWQNMRNIQPFQEEEAIERTTQGLEEDKLENRTTQL